MENLSDTALAALAGGLCPDCGGSVVIGPRAGNSVNTACRECGAEFNVHWWFGQVALAHRNSPKGEPDRERLQSVFGIKCE